MFQLHGTTYHTKLEGHLPVEEGAPLRHSNIAMIQISDSQADRENIELNNMDANPLEISHSFGEDFTEIQNSPKGIRDHLYYHIDVLLSLKAFQIYSHRIDGNSMLML